MNILKQIRNWYSNLRKVPAKFSIQCDETGLTQTVKGEDGNEVTRLAWDQVANVFAYKRDLFSEDQICFVFDSTDLRSKLESKTMQVSSFFSGEPE